MKRVDFANTLRGLAAICVVISHYCGIFWNSRETVASLINAPVLPVETHPIPSYITWIHDFTLFNWGGYGVALFFLISGFVIPFSLKKLSRFGFFVNRVFRLVPTYVVGFSITLAAIAICTWYFSTQWPFTLREILIHYIPGLRDLLISRNIDGIVWTLEIEIKFYIICALFIAWFRTESLKVFFIPIALFFSSTLFGFLPVSLTDKIPLLTKMILYYRFLTPYLIFMFIGVSFHYLFVAKISAMKNILLIAGFFALMCIVWQTGPFQSGFYIAWSYAFALLTFALAYRYPKIFRANPVGDFFASISYPLYVCHGLAGYVGLRMMLDAGVPTVLALKTVTVVAITLAWLLHKFVEKPSLAFGKKLSQKRIALNEHQEYLKA